MDERLLLAVPALVLLLGLWRPRVGLLVLAASLPLFGSPPAGPYLSSLDLAGLSAVAVALRARPVRKADEEASHNWLQWPLIAWLTVTLVSLLPLTYHPPSWQPGPLVALIQSLPHADSASAIYTWRATQQLLVGFALFWAYRRVFRGQSTRPIALALAVGVGYLVPLGLLEHAGLIDLSAYRAIGAELYDLRLHSFFFHSGWLAQYLIVATPFAIAGLFSLQGRTWRLSGHALLGLTIVALLLTQQRGAWLAALAQLGFVALMVGPSVLGKRRVIGTLLVMLLITTLLVLAIGFIRPEIVESLEERLSAASWNLSGRLLVWQRSLRLSEETHLLGSGLGTFAATYRQSYPCGADDPCWLTAHSLYVHTTFERGVLGLLALLTLGWAAAACLRATPREGPNERRTLAAGLSTSLVGLAVYGFVQYIFFLENTEWLCWILLAAISLVGVGRASRPIRRTAQVLAALALLSLPLRLWAVAAPTDAGQSSFGFHQARLKPDGRTVAWTSARAGSRVPWEGETLLVELEDGHPRESARSLEVAISVDGAERWRGSVSSALKEVAVELGPPARDWIVLQIDARPTFRPFQDFRRHTDLPPSRDIRSLGVAVGRIGWRESPLQKNTVSEER